MSDPAIWCESFGSGSATIFSMKVDFLLNVFYECVYVFILSTCIHSTSTYNYKALRMQMLNLFTYKYFHSYDVPLHNIHSHCQNLVYISLIISQPKIIETIFFPSELYCNSVSERIFFICSWITSWNGGPDGLVFVRKLGVKHVWTLSL